MQSMIIDTLALSIYVSLDKAKTTQLIQKGFNLVEEAKNLVKEEQLF